MTESEIFTTKDVGRAILALGIPALLNSLVNTLYSMVDLYFVGNWVGPDEVAAIGVVSSGHFLMLALSIGLGIGASTLINNASGAKNDKEAKRVYAAFNCVFCVLIALSTFLISLFSVEYLQLFGADGDVLEPAVDYFVIMLMVFPLLSWTISTNIILHGRGRAKEAMINGIVPTIFNVLLTPFFIISLDRGLVGAAEATLISQVLGFGMTLFSANRKKDPLQKESLFKFNLDSSISNKILSVGSSVVICIFTPSVMVISFNYYIYEYYDEAGLVVSGILGRMGMLFGIIMSAIDGASRPLISHSYGEHDYDRIMEVFKKSILFGLCASIALYLLIALQADWISNQFVADPNIIALSSYTIIVVLALAPVGVLQTVLSAYFVASGKEVYNIFLSVLKNIVLIIPSMYFLAAMYGGNGIIWAFPLHDFIFLLLILGLIYKFVMTDLKQMQEKAAAAE